MSSFKGGDDEKMPVLKNKNRSVTKGGGCDMAINKTVNKLTKTHGARDRNILKTFNINVTKGELLDEFIRNNERRNGVLRVDEEERSRRTAEDAELAGYYQQVQDALEGTGTGDRAEGIEDFTAGEVAPGERRSIREALATKGRTKRTPGTEDRKREEQLPILEQQAKRNRRRAR